MTRQFILVDFENVQPASLGALKPGDADVRVFLGQHQTRVDVELVKALQRFGEHGQYIQITGSGKDALDFHIAFYIGRLSAVHPGSSFTIVSRDTGFDPLVKLLATLGIPCKRVTTIPGAAVKLATSEPVAPTAPSAKTAKVAKATKAAKAPKKRASKAAKPAPHPRLQEVIDRLARMKRARPGTVKTLRSSLKAFNPPFEDADLDAMFEALQRHGAIRVTGTRVAYSLAEG